MLKLIYMTRILDMSFFLLKVNNPSVYHPVWPCHAPRLPPVWPPLGIPYSPSYGPTVWTLSSTPPGPCSAPVGSKKNKNIKNKIKIILLKFLGYLPARKERKKMFSFRLSISKFPKFPEFPVLRRLHGRSREKKKVFSA